MAVELVREVMVRVWRCSACRGDMTTRGKDSPPEFCCWCGRRNELVTAVDPVVKAKPLEEQEPA